MTEDRGVDSDPITRCNWIIFRPEYICGIAALSFYGRLERILVG